MEQKSFLMDRRGEILKIKGWLRLQALFEVQNIIFGF